MADLLMQKHFGALRPMDEAGEEALRSLPAGAVVRVSMKRPRNVLHHRKFFALLNLVLSNQEHYASQEELLDAIKIGVGHVRLVQLPSGQVYKIPKSISFGSMDQPAFEKFYDAVCDLIVDHFLPGVTKEELAREIEELIAA